LEHTNSEEELGQVCQDDANKGKLCFL